MGIISVENSDRLFWLGRYSERVYTSARLFASSFDQIPQIRINELHKEQLLPFAKEANVDFIWVHGASTVLESTFAHSLNSRNTPTLVVEMGVGMRITKEYGNQLVEGILHLMKLLHIWEGEDYPVRKPVISSGYDDVCFLNAPSSGIFLKEKNHGAMLKKEIYDMAE